METKQSVEMVEVSGVKVFDLILSNDLMFSRIVGYKFKDGLTATAAKYGLSGTGGVPADCSGTWTFLTDPISKAFGETLAQILSEGYLQAKVSKSQEKILVSLVDRELSSIYDELDKQKLTSIAKIAVAKVIDEIAERREPQDNDLDV